MQKHNKIYTIYWVMYHTVHWDKQKERNSRSCRTQCKTTKITSVTIAVWMRKDSWNLHHTQLKCSSNERLYEKRSTCYSTAPYCFHCRHFLLLTSIPRGVSSPVGISDGRQCSSTDQCLDLTSLPINRLVINRLVRGAMLRALSPVAALYFTMHNACRLIDSDATTGLILGVPGRW